MRLLDLYPLPTKMVTSGTLYTAGDAIAQYVDGTIPKRGYNVERGLKGAIWGGVIFAPLAHLWYNRVLERYVVGSGMKPVLIKVALDQTAWALVINAFYLSYASAPTPHRARLTLPTVPPLSPLLPSCPPQYCGHQQRHCD